MIFGNAVTFPLGLSASQGIAATAATAAASYSIEKNGSAVGTMNFAVRATSATFTMAAATTFNAGDVLTVVAPAAPDATLAGLAWTLVGSS